MARKKEKVKVIWNKTERLMLPGAKERWGIKGKYEKGCLVIKKNNAYERMVASEKKGWKV